MSKLCKLLREAIKDEKQAPTDYQKIKNKLLGHSSEKDELTKVQNDEKKHHKTIIKIAKSHGCKI